MIFELFPFAAWLPFHLQWEGYLLDYTEYKNDIFRWNAEREKLDAAVFKTNVSSDVNNKTGSFSFN